MKNKNTKKKTERFKKIIENKGFYIALVSLVVIVGFSIYARQVQTSLERDIVSFDETAWQEAVSESGIEVIDIDEKPPTNNPPAPVAEPKKKEEKAPESKDVFAQNAVVQTVAKEPEKFVMEMPLSGEIIAKCSLEELVYCQAMDDWRTHNGTDIAAAEGDPVKASEAGVVSKVYEDEFLGVVVEVEHPGGIVSRYGNLQSVDFIKVGTQVKKGDIIGGVGKPGALETGMKPHLHFEIQAAGEYKNPQEYIKNF